MEKARSLNRGIANVANEQKIWMPVESENRQIPEVKITLLWLDISGLSKTSQFVYCCAGLFAFYLVYGFLLELIFTIDGLKNYGWYVTLMQFGYYSIFGCIENFVTGFKKRRIPLKLYLLLAALTLGTVGFSNTSLQYLNYPTQVIFKCCKLIPVMIGCIVIQKKKYGILDFLAAIFMCIGLAWFTLADSYMSPNFNTVGVLMISFALLCDAAIGNVQEKAMKTYNVTNAEVVLYSYSLGFLYLLILLVVSGKFFSGFFFSMHNPILTYGYGLLFSACGYLGVQIVLTLIKSFGALIAVTVTTCRKAVSIAFSFLFFSKPFTLEYFWSGLLVLLGIYLNVYAKNHRNVTLREFICHLFLTMNSDLLKGWKRKKSARESIV